MQHAFGVLVAVGAGFVVFNQALVHAAIPGAAVGKFAAGKASFIIRCAEVHVPLVAVFRGPVVFNAQVAATGLNIFACS